MTATMKWALGVALFLSCMSFLVGVGSQLTDLGLSPTQSKAVIALFIILLGLGNSVNSVLIAFGFSTASKIATASSLSPSNKLAIAADVDGVKKIEVTSQALADSVSSDKVQKQ